MAHIVSAFDEDLVQVQARISEMGGLCEELLAKALQSVQDRDTALAREVIDRDRALDGMEMALEEMVVKIIALRQPVAADLRVLIAAMKISSTLERIGDLAKNIAKRVGAVGQTATPRNLSHSIDSMAGLVLTQVNSVIDHYVARDPEALKALRADDEKIDIQYTSVFRELLTYMMEDPRNITACTHLLFCAENAYYVMTGQLLPANRPKVDETAAMSAA
jgi:phosphate transport system protein